MSKLLGSKSRKAGSTWERIWDQVFGGPRRQPKGRKPRRLTIDALEQRMLLSLTPIAPVGTLAAAGIGDTLVNQVTSYNQAMLAGKSVAMDDNGDFVVTWARTDAVLDANGNYVTDVANGGLLTDSNIYARYFTNAVERIDLPYDPVTGLPTAKTIALQYNGNEIQQLTISAGSAPYVGRTSVSGTFDLTYYDPVLCGPHGDGRRQRVGLQLRQVQQRFHRQHQRPGFESSGSLAEPVYCRSNWCGGPEGRHGASRRRR